MGLDPVHGATEHHRVGLADEIGLGAAAFGLTRVSGWARSPVIAAQVLFGLSGYVAAFEAERPLIGVPILIVVATELYLLATPEARLAYLER